MASQSFEVEDEVDDDFISVSSDVEISGLGLSLDRPLRDVDMGLLEANSQLYTALHNAGSGQSGQDEEDWYSAEGIDDEGDDEDISSSPPLPL
ncbi:hypothetical protein M406DRAFT_354687 [Cryphonectria parasitica EP155]|uniref:Uncharacterized protein n=1 Tax=Cryphonectria parasitica (strain ATCC 38755 / EP155) TaxID=660469 RepID=A0A9P4YCY2_CRYP1|nr:uncharacterized protein M406DRAFT_354687 [Cryphonectria parasitica EP155]KAF3771076.1 hypothetical protein M406DRAFT_354687 [Cryphonectria parasitica EP155]